MFALIKALKQLSLIEKFCSYYNLQKNKKKSQSKSTGGLTEIS